jgi:hypothetical protein
METAKVDIRKLQILNDRINQVIDALSQVRQSVHGIAHSTGAGQGLPFGAIAQPPYGQPQFPQPQQGFGGLGMGYGLGHAPFPQQPFYSGLFHTSPGGPQQVPWLSGYGGFSGFSHSNPEQDPFLVTRITQTFPYAQLPFPPVISLF